MADLKCNDNSGKKEGSWIIEKGIWLGKKAVITGAVVSSAPLLLPPLLVFSTLGLACSVPFGFVFATYSCTQNIMANLLPTPDNYYDDDVEDVVEREYGDLLQPGYVGEDEDSVQRAEQKQGYQEDEEAKLQTKYLQVEDALSVEETQVRNEKLIIEDMNEKPVIEMRKVIVSVHCGNKIATEQKNEECIQDSQKLVLVVLEETAGDVVQRNTLGDLNSAREIADECGLDLFDYTAGEHHSYNHLNHSQENDNIRSSETDGGSNLPVLRVSTKVAKSKHMNLQPKTDPITPSNEVLLNEENIWEQIDALRAIVGYSAPTHTTSVEEIKALYIFTGVEPPPSLADNADLVEMNEKLQLLKSVVGVK